MEYCENFKLVLWMCICIYVFVFLCFCICVLLHCNGGDRLVGVEYWEHFKHVLWTEEINQGIETQVRGNANGAGLTFKLYNLGLTLD